jgi:ABC-type nitrate/sulfonate/bicarbonate transport system ATPase subunit
MLDVQIDRKTFLTESGAERTVLHDVRFSIARGEIVGLLGASGVGKSTMLRILLGLDEAFEGQVRRDCHRIGVVFQEPRLLPWLTVAENIQLVVTADMPQPDIEALLATVRLPHVARLRPRQLSLGMARRVALARALAISPDLLVLDEPFASLDTRLGAGLADGVAAWAHQTGAAIVLATHDLAQALERVSRLLILAEMPATLCADLPVPEAGDGALYTKLCHDFAFLRADSSQPAQQAPPPPLQYPDNIRHLPAKREGR